MWVHIGSSLLARFSTVMAFFKVYGRFLGLGRVASSKFSAEMCLLEALILPFLVDPVHRSDFFLFFNLIFQLSLTFFKS